MVSVIVPVYNAEKTIHNTINSILNQTYADIEVILINDGSKDNSLAICQEISNRDSRVKVINQENYGASVARNNGILAATGEWIFFVDADDFLPKDALKKLINISNKHENKNVELIIGCNYTNSVNENAELCHTVSNLQLIKATLNPKKHLNALKTIIDLCEGGIALSPPWGKLIRRKILLDNNLFFPVGLTHHEDTLFCINLFNVSKDILLTSIPVYTYNHLTDSVSIRFNDHRLDDMGLVIKHVYNLYNKNQQLNEDVNIFIIYRLLNCFFGYITHKDNFYSFRFIHMQIKNIINSFEVKSVLNKYKLNWFINNKIFQFKERIILLFIKSNCAFIPVLLCEFIKYFKKFLAK